MTLPRFNSGSLGRLSFEHVNEICDVVERLRPLLTVRPDLFAGDDSPIVFGRITFSTSFGDHKWVEVVPEPKDDRRFATQWQDRPGGRQSFSAADGDKYQPAFAIYPFTFAGSATEIIRYGVGTVCALTQITGADGKAIWLILSGSIEYGTIAKITGNTAAPNSDRRWTYQWVEVIPDPANPASGWVEKPNGRRSGSLPGDYPAAQNGTEFTGLTGWADAPATVTRLPIPNGTIVVMQLSPVPLFSLTNGLKVECPVQP